jgi:arylsulfatase A-like enzyme
VSTAHIVAHRPAFACIALLGLDKASHSDGHDSPLARRALAGIDAAVGHLRTALERSGAWNDTDLWIVSDHGHSAVHAHDDLADLVRASGHRVLAHPWLFTRRADVAVMVSGNAMAHLYLDVRSRARTSIELDARWHALADLLLERPSVDLLLSRQGRGVHVRTASRGHAGLWIENGRYHYRRESGDPLGIGADLANVTADDAYDATIDTDYPDGVVQIVHLATAPRSGELILSAARDWDFRARYEPIPHVSSHGALHREHMMVPLLVNRPVSGRPRRTVDVMPSALAALGKPIPPGLDGHSFL